MKNPQRYVGRIVRLDHHTFAALQQHARRQGTTLDNRFIVADVARELRKLICYGANFRVVVGTEAVALV